MLIPPAVWREVVEGGFGKEGSAEVAEGAAAGWIKVVELAAPELVQELRADLGQGESEAIALALLLSADILLIDEIRGRRAARHRSLKMTGFIGVLIEAAKSGKIESIRDEMDRVMQDSRFRISEDLYHQALRAAGESPGQR